MSLFRIINILVSVCLSASIVIVGTQVNWWYAGWGVAATLLWYMLLMIRVIRIDNRYIETLENGPVAYKKTS